MIRGLAQHITEADISDDIQSCGLLAKDIRLIRKKETGTEILREIMCVRAITVDFPTQKPMYCGTGTCKYNREVMCDRNLNSARICADLCGTVAIVITIAPRDRKGPCSLSRPLIVNKLLPEFWSLTRFCVGLHMYRCLPGICLRRIYRSSRCSKMDGGETGTTEIVL